SWTSCTRCICTSREPRIRSTSCGLTAPWMSCWPTVTRSPSDTRSLDRIGTGTATSSPPSSGTTMILRAFSVSSILTRPSTSLMGAMPFGEARLEQFLDSRQAVGDVLACHTTGVERPHGQLGAGLTDRLRRDDTNRLADVDPLAGGQRPPVALGADAHLGLTDQHAV